MNRNDRRKKEQLAKKKQEWGKSLTQWQKEYIQECVDAAKEFSIYRYIDIIDAAVSGALIEMYDFSFDDTWHVTQLMGKYMAEIMKEENRLGNERMIRMKKVENRCLEMIEELLKSGKKKAEIIKLVRSEFKADGVTTAEVNIAYKKVLEDWDAKKSLEISVEKIKNNIDIAKAEAAPGIVEKEDNEFEILKEIVVRDVKGQYGVYHIENKTVEFNGLSFMNKEQIKDWSNSERQVYLDKIAELQAKMQAIYMKEAEIAKIMDVFM